MPQLGDRDEGSQLPQLHSQILSDGFNHFIGRITSGGLRLRHGRLNERGADDLQLSSEHGGLMGVTCPIDFDVASLRHEVRTMYARVAAEPEGDFHFHRGPHYASTVLGYDAAELAALPSDVTSSFAGVGNPHAIGRIPVGAAVLDIGCGAGMDLLLAAQRTGPAGRAIGIDMTEAMRRRALQGAAMSGLRHVDVRDGDATHLPVDDQSIDVVISNGVLNLVPEKERAVAEIARVLKPGGRVQIADIVIRETLPDSPLRDIDLWTG
jgi:SAM-dependent methyltransferase